MKLVAESLEDIFRTGEYTLPPFHYRKGSDSETATMYYFDTYNGGKYRVSFFNLNKFQKNIKENNWVGELSAGEGFEQIFDNRELFQIINTTARILEDFINEKQPLKINFDFSKNVLGRSRRPLYLNIIRKNLPREYTVNMNILKEFVIKRT